jgi:hypothetical protein
MLSIFIIVAVAGLLMIWVASGASVGRRGQAQGGHPMTDGSSLPPATGFGGFSGDHGCDGGGGGGCDGGGN